MSLPVEMLLFGLTGEAGTEILITPVLHSRICEIICESAEVSRNRFLPSSLQCMAFIQQG